MGDRTPGSQSGDTRLHWRGVATRLGVLDTFITSTVIMTALAGGLASPVFVVAWKRRRADTIRTFGFGALIVGALCGVIAYVSRVQVDQCRGAGAGECIDWGAAGMQFTLVLIFVLFAWAIAGAIWRD